MNKVMLVGRLTKDVEIRGEDDKAFARFSVACQRPFKSKDSDTYEADFPNCKAFGKTAEFIAKYFGKGDHIGITGRIETGSYENKDGDTVYYTEVVAENAEFVSSKKDKDDSDTPRKSSKKKPVYDDDDDDYEPPKKKRRPAPDDDDDDDDDDEEYERPKKKRKSEPEDADDDLYPF